MKLNKVFACTLGACAIIPMCGSGRPAFAQSAPGASVAYKQWNPSDEISFTGTIQGVVTGQSSGTSAGVNLQLDGATSFQYASLGTQLNSSTKAQLAAGQPVTLKGVVTNLNGQAVLVVRELTINQHTVQLRNAKGMPSTRVEVSAYQGNRAPGAKAVKGGAQ